MATKPFPGMPGQFQPVSSTRLDWLSIVFAILAIGAGGGIAIAVQQFGPIALLLLPAIALFVISVLYPELGLMALIFVSYTQTSNVLIKFYNAPSIAQPLAVLMLVVIIIRMFVFGDHAEGWLTSAVRFTLYGFVILLAVLAAKSFDPAMVKLQDYIKDALIALIVVFMVQSPARFKHAIWAIIIAGLLMGGISSFQHLTHTYSNTYWGFGGWSSEIAGQATNIRVTGPFTNPNAFAQVLVVMVVLAVDRLWHDRNIILRLIGALAVAVGTMTIFFTYSRGGLLALTFAIGMFLVERRPKILPIILTAAIGLVVFQFLPSAYTERIGTLRELLTLDDAQIYTQSYRGRLSENTTAWLIFRDYPVLGVGPGNFSLEYQNYSRQLGLDPRNVPRSPASLYGELISEYGLIGLMAFAIFMLVVHDGLRKSKKLFTEVGLIDAANMSVALWGGLAGYLFVAINKNSAYSTVFWLLIGLAMASTNVAIYCNKIKQTTKLKEIQAHS
jgi:putative inorganic carbon (hco3(-)) transporter